MIDEETETNATRAVIWAACLARFLIVTHLTFNYFYG